MNIKYLIAMVNDISHYFTSEADHASGVAAVAHHLRKSWDPAMRRQITAYLDSAGEGLEPLAREAVQKLAEMEPPRVSVG